MTVDAEREHTRAAVIPGWTYHVTRGTCRVADTRLTRYVTVVITSRSAELTAAAAAAAAS